jgi:hypothetical protein
MKTAKQIQERINSLEDSYFRLEDQFSHADEEESLEIEIDMMVIEAKINSLKWVLN